MEKKPKKIPLKARCIDCKWQDQLDRKKGLTSMSWYCPKSGKDLLATKGSLYARRKCDVFCPKSTDSQ